MRHGGGCTDVDDRVDRVAEPQLQPGAELVPQCTVDIGPAVGGQREVDPVGQPASGELADLLVEQVEVGAQRGPAVDDEEHVAVRVVGVVSLAPQLAVGSHVLDAVIGEQPFPVRQDGLDLGGRAADPVGVHPAGDAADVRQAGERGEAAAAEVQAVELDFSRGVGQGESGEQGAQQGALASLGAAGDADVAADAGQVGDEQPASLLERLVHDRDRYSEAAAARGVRGAQPEARHGDQRWEDLVQRGWLRQRRQPHLVRRRSLGTQPADGDLQQRLHPIIRDGWIRCGRCGVRYGRRRRSGRPGGGLPRGAARRYAGGSRRRRRLP